MISWLRVLVLLMRPPVMVLLALYATLGAAQAGRGEDLVLLAGVLVVVAGFLLFSVAWNDIADEAIDRVNLPDDRRRPLISGMAGRSGLIGIAGVGAIVALATSAAMHWPATAVLMAGMIISVGYSLRPVRLADRGVVASLALPACYVAVPYLVGLLVARGYVIVEDLVLLVGLYIAFIGRIVLKDFRDVRGDALFGKRTFLVRHGRAWTCLFSLICWICGTIVVVAAVDLTVTLLAVYGVGIAAVAALLRTLSRDGGPRRDEAIIAAIAVIGRGKGLILLAHLSILTAQWPPAGYTATLAALAALTGWQAWTMVRHGPTTRLTVPPPNPGRPDAGPRFTSPPATLVPPRG